MASVSNGKRHVVKRKQTREKVCGLCLNANSCNMQIKTNILEIRKAFPPPFSTEFSPLYICCNIHHFGITKRKVMASKLQVTPTKLQVTPHKTTSYAYKTTSYYAHKTTSYAHKTTSYAHN